MNPPGLSHGPATPVDLICVVLLILLLSEKELIRAYSHDRARARYLNAAVVPLLIAAVGVFAARLAAMLS